MSKIGGSLLSYLCVDHKSIYWVQSNFIIYCPGVDGVFAGDFTISFHFSKRHFRQSSVEDQSFIRDMFRT